MPLISPELKQKFETLRQNIVASGSTNTLAMNKAEVRLIKDQNSEAKVRGFTVIQDEPETIGGQARVQLRPTISSRRSASART